MSSGEINVELPPTTTAGAAPHLYPHRHSSDEACEQSWATGCGVGGAKGGDRGEHGRATHAPDAKPGKCVPGAGPCTASSKGKEEGTAHRAAPPCERRPTQGCLFLAQAECGAWGGRGHVAGLRAGPRSQHCGFACPHSSGRVSGAAIAAEVHRQTGWAATPARHCCAG